MKFVVSSKQKLVPFLQGTLSEEFSGKALRRLLEAHLCRVNGRVERFGSIVLSKGDVVELSSNWQAFLAPKNQTEKNPSFQTLFEDQNFWRKL